MGSNQLVRSTLSVSALRPLSRPRRPIQPRDTSQPGGASVEKIMKPFRSRTRMANLSGESFPLSPLFFLLEVDEVSQTRMGRLKWVSHVFVGIKTNHEETHWSSFLAGTKRKKIKLGLLLLGSSNVVECANPSGHFSHIAFASIFCLFSSLFFHSAFILLVVANTFG